MSQPEIIADRYEILAEIGQGGMGKVYRGRDTKTGEIVAVKALKPEVVESDPSMVERFDREGEALRRLNHPNIVRVLANIHENDAHYLVMDYVAGGTLHDLMQREQPLPIDRVLDIALDLSDALTRAHRLKILHRDIKPANVLIAEDGTPRLTDFGVARIEDRSRVTEAGMIIGTYNYLSPEAIHGQEPDERADIWAFGVMLFEILTGKRPFEQAQVGAIIGAILNDPTPDLLPLRPDIPPALAQLVYSMLEKDRDQRISSARQIGVAIEDIIRTIDSGEIPLDSALKREVQQGTRFDMTPTANPGDGTEAGQGTRIMDDAIPTPSFNGTPLPAPPKGASYTYTDASGNQFVVTSAGAEKRNIRNRWLLMGLLPVVAVGALLLIAFAVLNNPERNGPPPMPTLFGGAAAVNEPTRDAPPDTEPAQPTPPPDEAAPGSGGPPVPPVADGEIMVIVARLEFTGVGAGIAQNDPTRSITDDLIENLQELPYSPFVVRPVQATITNSEQAREFAAQNNAPIIVWGTYEARDITVHIQIGDPGLFNDIDIDRETLEQTINVRLQLALLRDQTIAPYVIGALGMLYAADGDAYNYMKNATLNTGAGQQPIAAVSSSGISQFTHAGYYLHNSNTEEAIRQYDTALEQDGDNPLVYAMMGLAKARLQWLDDAMADAATAARLGPDGWATPLYIRATSAISGAEDQAYTHEVLNEIIALRPGDWYAHTMRGGLRYQMGQYDAAMNDLERAAELDPDISLPLAYMTMIALRGNDLDMARDLASTVLQDYADPTIFNRVFAAAFGETPNPHVIFGSTFGYLLINQPRRALDELDRLDDDLVANSSDLSFFAGLATCSLDDIARAEDAFANAIEADPEFGIAHLMYVSTLQAQGKQRQAIAYSARLRDEYRLIASLRELITLVQEEELSCDTLLTG